MNHPIIYDKFDTTWQHPIAIPHNSYNEKIHEVMNGEYSLTFNNPLDKKSQYIKNENYIEVDGEIFIIRNVGVGKDQDSVVAYEVKAEHVFYEMLDDYIPSSIELLEATPQDILMILSQYTNFNFSIEGTYEAKYFLVERGTPIKLINKMLETWDMEMHRNRRNVAFKPSINAEKLQLFRWGKNIKSLKRTGSSEATTTRLYLIGKDGLTVEGLNVASIPYHMVLDGDTAYFYNNSTDMVLQFIADTQINGGVRTLKNMYIDSKYIDNYPRPKCNEHKVDSDDPLEILLQGLKELQKIEQEIENYEISVIELYKVKGELERFGLGWSVLIQDKDILGDKQNNMVHARITEYEHYPYQFEDSTVKIGYFNDNILDFLNKLRETKEKVDDGTDSWDKIKDMIDNSGTISAKWLNDRIQNAGDMIRFGQGNVIGSDRGLMVLDTDSIDTAKAIIIMTTSYNSSTGKTTPIIGLAERDNTTLDFEYRTAIDSRGINADEIVTGVLKTSLVKIFGDTNFYWDTNGMFCIDPDNTNKFMKISREGIRFTSDGGSSWDINISWQVNGFQATRQDKRVRASMTTTDGFKIEKGDGLGNWDPQIWADIDGKMHAKELHADKIKIADGTETLIDAETRTIDLSKFSTILGTLSAANIDATSLEVDAANIKGTLTANQINTNSIYISDLNGEISANRINGGTISGVDINVNRDVYIGNNLYLQGSNTSLGKGVYLGDAYLGYWAGDKTFLYGAEKLVFGTHGDIILGCNGVAYYKGTSIDDEIATKRDMNNVIAVFG